jgi:hypothetical protein
VSLPARIDRDPDRAVLLIEHHDGHRQLDTLGLKMPGQDIAIAPAVGANGKDTAVGAGGTNNERKHHPVLLALPDDLREPIRKLIDACWRIIFSHHDFLLGSAAKAA